MKRPVRIRLREENLKNLKMQVDQLIRQCGEDARIKIELRLDLDGSKYYLTAIPKEASHE